MLTKSLAKNNIYVPSEDVINKTCSGIGIFRESPILRGNACRATQNLGKGGRGTRWAGHDLSLHHRWGGRNGRGEEKNSEVVCQVGPAACIQREMLQNRMPASKKCGLYDIILGHVLTLFLESCESVFIAFVRVTIVVTIIAKSWQKHFKFRLCWPILAVLANFGRVGQFWPCW